MRGKNVKALKRKIRQLKDDIMLQFFDSLKDVGLKLRLIVCWKLIFTNFRIFDKKKEVSNAKSN